MDTTRTPTIGSGSSGTDVRKVPDMALHRAALARRSVLVVPALGTLLVTSACGGGNADASSGESGSFSFTFATSNNME